MILSHDGETALADTEQNTDMPSLFSSVQYTDGEQSSSFAGDNGVSDTGWERGQSTERQVRQSTRRRRRQNASYQRGVSTRRLTGANTGRQRRARTGRQRRGNTGRQRGRSRSRGRQSTRQPSDRPELEVVNICTKTDTVKEVFPFTPVYPAGFHLPSGVDTSNPEALFKLFFGNDIVE